MKFSALSVALIASLASATSPPTPTTGGDKNAAAAASAAKAEASAKASIAAEIQAVALAQVKAEEARLQQIFNSMPKCATACLKNSTAHVGCNMTDIECQCGKLRPLVVDVAPCMIKLGCDMQQMMTAGSTLFTLCLDAYNKTHNNSLPPLQQLMAEQANQAKAKTSASSQGYIVGWTGVAAALALAVTFT